MTPTLLQLAGPQRGAVFQLTEKESSIGREPTNWLPLNDVSASRHHCLIRNNAGQYSIIDLESRNGTFVNDTPARERVLQHGDRIGIGNCVFLFLLHETKTENAVADFQDDYWMARTTLELNVEKSAYLHTDAIQTKLQSTDRLAAGLSTLLKISTAINSLSDEKGLQKKLINLILEVVPAERAAILILENGKDLSAVCTLDKNSQQTDMQISRTIANRVFQDRIAILSNDVQQNENLVSVTSLSSANVTSLLVVALIALNECLGVIYLETGNSNVHFDEDHLQWMAAVASIAAAALINVRNIESLKLEKEQLLENVTANQSMIGESACMQEIYKQISKVAPTNSTVLIRGESGTGKELVARSIHQNSLRADKPFVVVNCTSLTESLLESELFGHEKGAFTGAINQKKGKLEIADGGSVFLDEIGELSPALQSKLLRVLQEREFDRVGGTRPIKIDVRFIAATNKDLEQAIVENNFRSDLFYRLNVITINLPPLRERREDIPLLATHFAKKHSKQSKKKPIGISGEARSYLRNYDWPGNVRELENVIERAIVLTTNDAIFPEDLPETLLEKDFSEAPKYHQKVKELKKELLLKAFEEAAGNYSEAARLLGIHPNNFHRLVRNLNLQSLLKTD
jgi:transcriptional regulator with GAF, ATPase, and Fis domain